jgi:antagonist of KipI
VTAVEVLDAGPMTSVQTVAGRAGWQHLGVPVGGAADPWSALLAIRLAGAADDAPVLECTIDGPRLRLGSPTLVAVTGPGWTAALDGLPLPPHGSAAARAGAVLHVRGGAGARGYVAIAGLSVEPVLGSAATDLRSGFGGHAGRALVAGDRLTLVPSEGALRPRRWTGDAPSGPIRIVSGPHAGPSFERIVGAPWRVGSAADRTGVRLAGVPLAGGSEVASMGLPLGAIQLPPDGLPIVMLADRPVTGGYPVPACVIRADIGRVAQLRPGDEVSFTAVSRDDAVIAWQAMEESLDALEPFTLAGDEDVDWAGSLG